MAYAGNSMTICCICQHEFTKPKFLDCHHSICEKCIDDFVKSTQTRLLNCPLCGRMTIVPIEGAKMLTSNFYLESKYPGIISKSPRQYNDGNGIGGHRERGHNEHLNEQDSTHASRARFSENNKDSRCQTDSTRSINDVDEERRDDNIRRSDIQHEEHENSRERIEITSEYNNIEFDENDDGGSFYFRFNLDQIKEDFYGYRKFSTQDQMWYVSIHKDAESDTLWLNLCLKTNGSSVDLESCVASIKMSVLNNLSYDSSITKEDVKKFTVSGYDLCYNWRDVIAWGDLTDENKGFIDEHNCFTLVVHLDVRDIHTLSPYSPSDCEGQNVVGLHE